ncbi:arginase family protein [Microbacterium tumbae]
MQIGIADFASSPAYARRAAEWGIRVITLDELRRRGVADLVAEALEVAGAEAGARIHLDIDVDVCDRSVAPGCPASVPAVWPPGSCAPSTPAAFEPYDALLTSTRAARSEHALLYSPRAPDNDGARASMRSATRG